MKTLNLTSLENSGIKYKINNYPDGQRDIVIDNSPDLYGDKLPGDYYWVKKSRVYTLTSVQIKSRLNNMEDLGLIICATQALRNLGVKEIHLYTPWIMGLRSDRLFQEGGVRYIKDVIAPLLNSENFESITCYDAHSYVAENCINNLKIIDNLDLILYSLGQIYKDLSLNQFILVSPDDGASKKIYKIAEQIGYTGDIITCSKDRDENGKLTKTIIPGFNTDHNNKDLIIIDDICDGGATFINIAKKIKSGAFAGKLYLIVTHSILSKGTDELFQYFDGIYTTNSYQDLMPDTELFVKQLNVY